LYLFQKKKQGCIHLYLLFVLARGPPPRKYSPRQHHEPSQTSHNNSNHHRDANNYQNSSNHMQNIPHSGAGYPQNQASHVGYQQTNSHQQQNPHSGYQQPQRLAGQIPHAGYNPHNQNSGQSPHLAGQQSGPYSSHHNHHHQSNMQQGHRGKNIVARIRNDEMSESSSEEENGYIMKSGQSDGYHKINTGRLLIYSTIVFPTNFDCQISLDITRFNTGWLLVKDGYSFFLMETSCFIFLLTILNYNFVLSKVSIILITIKAGRILPFSL